MKIYVFLTSSIRAMGGMQCYVAGKAKYLEKEGWKVIVVSNGFPNMKISCPISYFNKFIPYLLPGLNIPPFKLPTLMTGLMVNALSKKIRKEFPAEEVIIESHDDKTSFWAELLASKLNGRHVFFAINEIYRGPNKFYKQKIDFFTFKFDRGEIVCAYSIANRLFEGYRTFKEGDVAGIWLDEDPVQDVENIQVNSIIKCDYNICYIGRAAKSYVPNIIKGVGEFSSNHRDKSVQLVMVGESSCQQELLAEMEKKNRNLVITQLGDVFPLPKALFRKVNVVIAGSGSARCATEEGCLTIIAGTETNMALGILGYDTNNSLYIDHDSIVTSFYEALERALIQKVYLSMVNKYPPKRGVAECTKQNFKVIGNAKKELEYFDINKLLEGRIDYMLTVRLMLKMIYHTFR